MPPSNQPGEEGSNFALVQARLGPGGIRHCMRSTGAAELALELMTERAQARTTFGKKLYEHGPSQNGSRSRGSKSSTQDSSC